MRTLLDRRIVVVTGKGGVGKSTITCALGLLAAARGKRTILLEVGRQQRLPQMFGRSGAPHDEIALEHDLWTLSIDSRRALLEWIEMQPGGRLAARVLGPSTTFRNFVDAAPGAHELTTIGKAWDLVRATGPAHSRRRGRRGEYDLAVLDAPSTGHALALLRAPRTFSAMVRGPIAAQARRIDQFLRDPSQCGYVAVAQGTEMTVSETLELRRQLGGQLGRDLNMVVANAVLGQRFDAGELAAITAAADAHRAEHIRSAAHAARFAHRLAESHQQQIGRLRASSLPVAVVPLLFKTRLHAADLRAIAQQLGGSP